MGAPVIGISSKGQIIEEEPMLSHHEAEVDIFLALMYLMEALDFHGDDTRADYIRDFMDRPWLGLTREVRDSIEKVPPTIRPGDLYRLYKLRAEVREKAKQG